MIKQRQTDWKPPRGITLVSFPLRPAQPYGVQWRIEGKRKTKTFPTKEKQLDFAKSLAGDAKQNGLAAFKLDEGEAREWRAFRAMIGAEADLQAVAACWERNKASIACDLTFPAAVLEYTAAKEKEGVSQTSIDHYKPIFDRFEAIVSNRKVAEVTEADLAAFMDAPDTRKASQDTKRSRHARIVALFNWLVETRKLDRSPFGGLKKPKAAAREHAILTLEQSRLLFSKNVKNEDGKPIDQARRETLGRIALEAFVGLRFSTAAQIVAGEIQVDGLRIPAAKIKTRKNQFLDGLPANVHEWLEWSQPENWTMTPRQYLEAKSAAFIRAGVPHPRNCLRHGFASYHVAAFKDAPRTSLILCHKSPKLLWDTYRGLATEADGKAYFQISPTADRRAGL